MSKPNLGQIISNSLANLEKPRDIETITQEILEACLLYTSDAADE